MSSDTDEREIRFKKQREERGWDDSETWSLYSKITDFVLPRLKRFRELHKDYPMGLSIEKWDDILDKMILAFEILQRDEYSSIDEAYRQSDQIKVGLKLFAEYYTDLWW